MLNENRNAHNDGSHIKSTLPAALPRIICVYRRSYLKACGKCYAAQLKHQKIQQRHRAAQKIAAHKQLLNLFFNIIYCTILATDKDGRKGFIAGAYALFHKTPGNGVAVQNAMCYNIF